MNESILLSTVTKNQPESELKEQNKNVSRLKSKKKLEH